MPTGFIREPVATGLNPASMVIAPDGRIFIVEKHGAIRIVRDGILLPEPFLQITVEESNERGLGHMALHPDFDLNGYYFVYYSVYAERFNRISRFTAIGDKTLPGSEQVIMELDPGAGDVHNGGAMLFGDDGYLYVATGDGAQPWNGENIGSTNGKVLRMDVDGNPLPDNPWYDLPYLRAAYVYAYGFRNPFTMTKHPVTGEVYINEVGEYKYEEINRLERGAFYGWPKVEGKRTNQALPPEYRDPVFQYTHSNYYCAIVGSIIYAPAVQRFPPEYTGRYFYSDYCTGHIRMLDMSTWQDRGVFISDGNRVVALGVAGDGSFYYLERQGIGNGSAQDNTSTDDGVLWKVTYTGSGAPFISVQPLTQSVSAGEEAVFTMLASGAPPLSYVWYVDDEPMTGHQDQPEWRISDVTPDLDSTTIWVEISNAFGTIASDTVFLLVTSNRRPMPVILSPPDGLQYAGGQLIGFAGMATDTEDGLLPDTALAWRIDFHHGAHTHPAMPWTQSLAEGSWQIPAIGETSPDVWYRIYLRAKDSEGLSQIVYRDIYPQLGSITVTAQPPGLEMLLDGVPVATPFVLEGVWGVSRYISPPDKQTKGDSIYFFRKWADGAELRLREVSASGHPQTFTGEFDAVRKGNGYGLTVKYYDNTAFEGEPVATGIDPVVHHHYYNGSPHPDVPADYFGIVWKGYVQPYRSGVYTFTLLADDAGFMSVGRQPVIQNWQPGVIYEKGSYYMEEGKLYPVHIRLTEYGFFSQVSLRWSSDDFTDEVIPSSQLFPENIFSDKKIPQLIRIAPLASNTLEVLTESYTLSRVRYTIIDVTGRELASGTIELLPGKNIPAIDISRLAPGLYYFRYTDALASGKMLIPFVKGF